MKKIKWGIISTAKIGIEKVIPAIQNAYNSEVIAIASRNEANAKEVAAKLGIPKYYGSYADLLGDEEIDAIYNPLPNHLHLPLSLDAIQKNKHVLCEKPIGLDAAEAIKLRDVAKENTHLKIMEAFMYRFHPQWQKAKALVDEGTIGDVRSIQSFFSYFNTDPNNIRNQLEIGGGALMDIGCYCISFPRFIFECEPKRAIGLIARDREMKVDFLSSGMLDFGSGLSGTFTCSTQLSPYQRAQIVGSKGRIEIEIPVNAPNDQETRIILNTQEGSETISFSVADQYQLMAEKFADAIINNTNVPTNIEDAVNNMRVIDALFESERCDKWIQLDLRNK